MSTGDQPSEEELRAAYEAELKKIRVEQILLEQVVTLINLGMRRTGMVPGTEDERDPGEVRLAIEAVRALLPLIDQSAAAQAGAVRDALSQLQMAYVRIGGGPEPGAAPGGGEAPSPPGQAVPDGPGDTAPGGPQKPPAPPASPEAEPGKPGEPGPAQRSGRLWVPGQ